jgi:formylmethanofuran dehydrogenase subunit E
MHDVANGRFMMEMLIRDNDLESLLRYAEILHGHLCPYVGLGVKAGQYAMAQLNRNNNGMEEIVAIVECNNCFTDGIQIVTGCTFGNNALIFKDWGKTAVTVARREDGAALRLAVRADYHERMMGNYPGAGPLFQKIVVQRQGTEAEKHQFHHLWEEISAQELSVPVEDQFIIQELKIELPEYARIFASVTCAVCGEKVMEPRVRLQEGKPICLPCLGESYFLLTGQGMSLVKDV